MATRGLGQLFLITCVLKLCGASGTFYFHAISFTSGCKEGTLNNCDFMFTFCFDRPGGYPTIDDCLYRKTIESDNWSGKLDITFGSDINGIVNPITFYMGDFKVPKVLMIVRLRDAEPGNKADYITQMYTTITFVAAPSYNSVARYTSGVLNWRGYNDHWSGTHSLRYEYKAHCNLYYYGQDCTFQCNPNMGPYTCGSDGQKICSKEWQGDNCDEDVDECQTQPGLCASFSTSADVLPSSYTCNNTIGSYECVCAPGRKGRYCDEDVDECQEIASLACLNDGNCSNTVGSYRCTCPSNWNGTDCGDDVDECAVLTSACSSPNSRCVNTIGGYSCAEEAIPAALEQEDGFLWWPIVVVVVVVVVAVAIGVFVIRRRRQRQSSSNRPASVLQLTNKGNKNISVRRKSCPKESPPIPPPERAISFPTVSSSLVGRKSSGAYEEPIITGTGPMKSDPKDLAKGPVKPSENNDYVEMGSYGCAKPTITGTAPQEKGPEGPANGDESPNYYSMPIYVNSETEPAKRGPEPISIYCSANVIAASTDEDESYTQLA